VLEAGIAATCLHEACIDRQDNFLCTGENMTVKLCDFGLAEVLPTAKSELKGVYGTAPFMSPEMLGAGGYGTATDVWSLGVIAYVLLFGQFPYQPVETTAKAMKAAILSGVPAPTFRPRQSLEIGDNSRTSAAALDFLHATLSRNKNARPSAAAALKMPWLNIKAQPGDPWSAPSLRPMLYAAKRTGAFDTRGVSSHDKSSSVDHLLNALHTGGSTTPMSRGSSALSGRRTDRTHSEYSLEVAAAKVQSGGVASNTSHVSTATGSSHTSYQSNQSKLGKMRQF